MNTLAKIEEECDLRGYSNKTKEAYIYHIRDFLSFIKKDPKLANINDVRAYILSKNTKPVSINLALSAIKFLYIEIYKRYSFNKLKSLKKEKHVPIVLPKSDIENMIRNTPNIKHKLLIELLYSSGLRVSEAVNLKLENIRQDEKIAIIKGKGKKERFVILSDRFILRMKVYLEERNSKSPYLFNNNISHITVRTVEQVIKQAAKNANIAYRVHPHALRASFATHLHANGVAEFNIQKLLGHSDIRTTRHYTLNNPELLKKIQSPLDAET